MRTSPFSWWTRPWTVYADGHLRDGQWLWTWKVFRMYILSRLVDYPIPAIGRGTIPTHPKSLFQKYHRLNEHHFKRSIKCTFCYISSCIVHFIVHCFVQVSREYRSWKRTKNLDQKFRAKNLSWSKRTRSKIRKILTVWVWYFLINFSYSSFKLFSISESDFSHC